ncbi:hypothetical protein [Morganella psychrotolerans]|nr:hypothetical protein [Morganella psychrotolerans]
MNSARFDIASAILSLHGIALWCAVSGVICVIDGDNFQLVVSDDK